MDQQELETYEYQLSQIKLGLAKDPHNAEMQTLKAELEDLINLTKEYLSSQAPAATASTSTATTPASAAAASTPKPASASASRAKPAQTTPAAPKQNYKAGDECSCRYSDGKWYPARITQISGSSDQPVYTVVFKGYDTPEVVSANDIRPSNKWDSAASGASGSGSGAGEKRKAAEPTKEDLEKERKKKKNEKKTETLKAKAEEQAAKQKGWQAFAKKGTKKGIHIPGVKGESIFRSPAEGNPNARVGVVGGGRGMTAIAQRKRQTFTEGGEE
ncbi:hypothetical protein BMF94_3542 [Rhodotorula taiwanensis]|uniref:Tudor domain-containing protein n=1 Tax=Rhodotorula taiwanensis TaxID=741276 RepID=A0A2S5B8X5_9BASI|nr:hypothetical protein BMF94_3542 [Rhodotorula taiwanensis]